MVKEMQINILLRYHFIYHTGKSLTGLWGNWHSSTMLVKCQFFLQEMVLHASKDVPVNLLAELFFELRLLICLWVHLTHTRVHGPRHTCGGQRIASKVFCFHLTNFGDSNAGPQAWQQVSLSVKTFACPVL